MYELAYLNFKAVLALPKMARSAQTHKKYKFHLTCLEHSICIVLAEASILSQTLERCLMKFCTPPLFSYKPRYIERKVTPQGH